MAACAVARQKQDRGAADRKHKKRKRMAAKNGNAAGSGPCLKAGRRHETAYDIRRNATRACLRCLRKMIADALYKETCTCGMMPPLPDGMPVRRDNVPMQESLTPASTAFFLPVFPTWGKTLRKQPAPAASCHGTVKAHDAACRKQKPAVTVRETAVLICVYIYK